MNRRQFLAMTAALGAGATLAACAPKEEAAVEEELVEEEAPAEVEATEPPAEPAAEEVEIRYMNWLAFVSDMLPDMLEIFQDEYPNVTVNVEELGQEDTYTKYTAMLVAGTAPDILYHGNFMSKFYDEGQILELDEYYERDGLDLKQDFWDGLAINDWAGHIYGVPQLFETCVMFYNKTMVEEYWGQDLWEAFPDGMWTFDDMLEVARACTQDLDGDDRIDQWGLYIYHRSYYYGYETLGWTWGDSIFDVQQMRYNFTSPTIQEVSHSLFDWVRDEEILIGQEDFGEISKAAAVNPFSAGKIALYQRMSPDISTWQAQIEDKFEWDVIYLPNYGDKPAITRAGGHGHNIAASTEVADMAYELCKAFCIGPGAEMTARRKLAVPPYGKTDPDLRDAYESGDPPHDDVVMSVLSDRGGYGDHMRFHNERETREIFMNKLDVLYNEPYEEAVRKLDDTMQSAEEEMNEAVDYGDELPFPDIEFPFPAE